MLPRSGVVERSTGAESVLSMHMRGERDQDALERDQAVLNLVESGEAHLLRAEAHGQYLLQTSQVKRGVIELYTAELSQLHAQLNSITTQSTLIIGFGLASIGADTLSTLASDEDQFCIYKSDRARALGAAYIIVTTVCICTCMSIIITAQIITYQSTRASFTCAPLCSQARAAPIRRSHSDDRTFPVRHDRRLATPTADPETKHIVQMTTILMHGDHRLPESDPNPTRMPQIPRGCAAGICSSLPGPNTTGSKVLA